jgi:hypothetical protein
MIDGGGCADEAQPPPEQYISLIGFTRCPGVIIRSGTFPSFCISFFARRAKNEIQKNGKYHAAAGENAFGCGTA